VLLAGCGETTASDGTSSAPKDQAPATTNTQAAHPSASSSPVETTCQLPDAAFEVRKRYSGSVALSRLAGQSIRLGAHDCYDSVVIELGGSDKPTELPGVYAHYVEMPMAEPSDRAVQMRGKYFLEITIGSAMSADVDRRLRSSTVPDIDEVVETQNFEGVTSWTIGLGEREPFTAEDISGTPGCATDCIVVNLRATNH
jgi:hypothetical protein